MGAEADRQDMGMNNILFKLREDKRFDVLKVNLETMKMEEDFGEILMYIEESIARGLKKSPFVLTHSKSNLCA